MSVILNLLLLLDGFIYNLVAWMFKIFEFLAKTNLFDNNMYDGIVRRIYVVLGMIMMFALAYSLLKAVINPDEFSKGENSFPKLIQNVVISLGIIAVLPTVFTVAFNIQNSILNYDTIPKIVLGENYNSQDYQDPGRSIAYNTFTAFLHVNEEYCRAQNSTEEAEGDFDEQACAEQINTDGSNRKWYKPWRLLNTPETFAGISSKIEAGASFINFSQFGEAIQSGKLSYIFILSTICGIFLLYVLVNFCFDMGVRVIKIMFFQIIAPVAVVCRIIPGGKMKDVFSTWVKKTISTFVDVFVRIFIMYLGIFAILTVISVFKEQLPNNMLSSTQLLIAKALIIMGAVVFIKQAPKLIADLFHLDTGDMKLGIMDKLSAGGAFAAGSFIGGGVTALTRNAVNKIGKTQWRDANGNLRFGNVAKGIGSVALSSLAGGASGALRSGKAGLKAKNFGDMKKSASEGAKAAVEKRYNREKYWASHSRGQGTLDDLTMVLFGHGSDAVGTAVSWAGYKNLEQLKLENAGMDEITNSKDAMENNIDAYIEKQMNKGKGAGIGEAYNLQHLKDLKNKIAEETANGGDVVGAQTAYNDELKRIRERVAEQLLVSSENWQSYDEKDRANLGELRVNAVAFKGAIYNNSNLDALKEVGIVGDKFAQDQDVLYGSNPDGTPRNQELDKMGDSIKIHRGDNKVEIATRSQEKKDDKK